jgi:hypothetical protein
VAGPAASAWVLGGFPRDRLAIDSDGSLYTHFRRRILRAAGPTDPGASSCGESHRRSG